MLLVKRTDRVPASFHPRMARIYGSSLCDRFLQEARHLSRMICESKKAARPLREALQVP